jgi:hypothetical protein
VVDPLLPPFLVCAPAAPLQPPRRDPFSYRMSILPEEDDYDDEEELDDAGK